MYLALSWKVGGAVTSTRRVCEEKSVKMQLATKWACGISLVLVSFNSLALTCTTVCGDCGLYSGSEMDACFERRRTCLDDCMRNQYNQQGGSLGRSGGYLGGSAVPAPLSPGTGQWQSPIPYQNPSSVCQGFCVWQSNACIMQCTNKDTSKRWFGLGGSEASDCADNCAKVSADCIAKCKGGQ